MENCNKRKYSMVIFPAGCLQLFIVLLLLIVLFIYLQTDGNLKKIMVVLKRGISMEFF